MPTSGSGRLRESANGSQESRRLGWRVCLANSLGLTQGLLSKRLLTKTAVSLCQTFAFVSESCSSGGSKRGCESLSIDGQRSTMHASPNASFCRGTRQAPQHAVLSTRRACNYSQCPPFARAGTAPCGGCVTHVWLLHIHAPALASVLTSSAFAVFEETPGTVCPWISTCSSVFLVRAVSRPPRCGSASQQPQASSVIQHASILYLDRVLGSHHLY
jgi:hypothetical protein